MQIDLLHPRNRFLWSRLRKVPQSALTSGLRHEEQTGDQHDQQGQSHETGIEEKAIQHAARYVFSVFDPVIEYPSHMFLSADILLLMATEE